MKTNHVLNYRVHIEKETKGKKTHYNASCPTLGLADHGRTIDEALAHITDLISFHIETLTQLGRDVPVEREATTIITSVHVPAGSGFHAAV